MPIKYQILFRACDKVDSVHNGSRPFGLSKLQTIKLCFYSIYQAVKKEKYQFTIIGDQLSTELLNFFKSFDNVLIYNERLGSASQSLKKQLEIALQVPDDQWIYLCEDDYLHTSNAFKYLSEFIENKERYLQTSGKKKNYINRIVGDLKNKPLIIHPSDYPDRYEPPWKRFSYIFLSKYSHWRQISNTTHTFLLQSRTLKQFETSIKSSAEGPSDAHLSEKVYGRIFFKNKALCVSPIRGLSTHMTKGVMTPLVNWDLVCKENIDIMKIKGIWK